MSKKNTVVAKKQPKIKPKKTKAKKAPKNLVEVELESLDELEEDDVVDMPEIESEGIEETEVETESEDEDVEIEGGLGIEGAQPAKKKNKFNNHKLKYDSIFKGKKHDTTSDEFSQDFMVPKQSTFELVDHHNTEDSYRLAQLDEIIYQFVLEKTTIDITASRRKPGRNEFNKYMQMLTDYVDLSLYSHGDIFCIFSTYFSDNIFSMFRLLDKKWGAIVAKELKISSNSTGLDDFEIV